jgi:hypothetical protein
VHGGKKWGRVARQPGHRDREGLDGKRLQQRKACAFDRKSLRSGAAGGSLFGLNSSNPYNPAFDDAQVRANGFVPGGIITFGGGVALYRGGV